MANSKEKQLPVQAQFSPVYTITPIDYIGDGHKDLLLCEISTSPVSALVDTMPTIVYC